MKNLFLFLLGTLCVSSVQGQHTMYKPATTSISSRTVPVKKIEPNRVHAAARTTTATTLVTETFGSGSGTSLPAGWKAGSFGGGTWHWANRASGSAYSMGVMNSATASDGWMIFDSDSIGTACSCAPAAWLQSRVYRCDTDSVVCLNFANYFSKYNDSCFVWVSNDSTFAAYTSYRVAPNNDLLNDEITANSSNVRINITSSAAGDSSVYIRFVYYDRRGQTGGYSWMIDDLNLTEPGPHDVGITNAIAFMPDASAFNSSVFSTPLVFADSIYPIALLSNFGSDTEVAFNVEAGIRDGGVGAYSATDSISNFSYGSYDSLLYFPSFFPPGVGNYVLTVGATLTGDADPTNNGNDVAFNFTDTLWQQNIGLPPDSYLIYGMLDSSTAVSYMQGVRFDVPSSSAGDTVSGFGVAFSPFSIPTTGPAEVSVQLYVTDKVAAGWTYVATSQARPITLTDISTPTELVWADFRIDPVASGGLSPFILHPGKTYAAVVQVSNVTTDLEVYATAATTTGRYAGYFGQTDTSNNDGATSFSPHSTATGIVNAVPMVRMYFGNISKAYTEVNNVKATADHIGSALPDPAATTVTIQFTLASDATVTSTLYNMVGQAVRVSAARGVAGQPSKITFAVSDMPPGVYMYSISANGQQTNGRVVVEH